MTRKTFELVLFVFVAAVIALVATTAHCQTVKANIVPEDTGYDLGNPSQRWDGFFQNLDVAGVLTVQPPVNATDAASKQYVDTTIAGVEAGIVTNQDITPASVKVDPLNTMPSDPHGITSSLGARIEAYDQDHRPIFYCGETIGGPCVSIHSKDTTLGRATSYEKGDGGGGARLFQRTIGENVCNLGAIGGYGAVAGIDTGKDDMAISYGLASDCTGASADLALKFRDNQNGDTWWLTADGSWVPQRDSASITIGYGTGKGKMRIANGASATVSFYNLRDGAQWMTFDDGVVGIPAWLNASGGLNTSRVQLDSSAVTCNASNKGTVNYVSGAAGVADTAQVCTKDATDTYAWHSIQQPAAGLSVTKAVKGSDGNNCNLVFTGGLLTSTTCP